VGAGAAAEKAADVVLLVDRLDRNTALNALQLPHQLAEEQAVHPEFAGRLGRRDPLGTMNRMREEIAHLTSRLPHWCRD
jgi:hypothetical protein